LVIAISVSGCVDLRLSSSLTSLREEVNVSNQVVVGQPFAQSQKTSVRLFWIAMTSAMRLATSSPMTVLLSKTECAE
jgi:hypothetical protein